MDTDDLIDSLVARHRSVDPVWTERMSMGVVVVGIVAAIALMSATMGFRADLMTALENGRIVAKYVFIVTALIISGHLFVEMTRPGRRLADQAIVYALPLGFVLVAVLIQFTLMGMPTKSMVLGDQTNWLACMIVVPILAILPFAGLLAILRKCAPTDLRGAGFSAGVFATTIGATVYASHCPCDMPVFVGIWYPLAFIIGGTAGAFVAPRVARW